MNIIDELGKMAFGRTKSEALAKGICIKCGKPPGKFSDELSEKEWRITRMCQDCQDEFYTWLSANYFRL